MNILQIDYQEEIASKRTLDVVTSEGWPMGKKDKNFWIIKCNNDVLNDSNLHRFNPVNLMRLMREAIMRGFNNLMIIER